MHKLASLHFDTLVCVTAAAHFIQFDTVCFHESHTHNNNSELLRTAMLDVYLGKDAVSPTAKQSFAAGMAKLFR
jgi:hypothetical protein